jgi:hypothetical protein
VDLELEVAGMFDGRLVEDLGHLRLVVVGMFDGGLVGDSGGIFGGFVAEVVGWGKLRRLVVDGAQVGVGWCLKP